jgi:hypothetical protein
MPPASSARWCWRLRANGEPRATAFADELVRGGGRVAAQGNHGLARNDITPSSPRRWASMRRAPGSARLQQITGLSLVHEPKPRADIDAIFVAGYQSLAMRQINPQLRFFNAGGVPTYITQDGLDPDERGNRDLEGMRFVDLPWMLEPTGPVADTRSATESAWSARGKRQSRYFAFGYDGNARAGAALRAERVARAGHDRQAPHPEGRVERNLDWARIRMARPSSSTRCAESRAARGAAAEQAAADFGARRHRICCATTAAAWVSLTW